MNKKFNKIFIVILTALMIVGLMSGIANAAYTGESDIGKSIMGQNYDNTRQFFAIGTPGQAIPTAGLFPVAGSDGTYSRAILTDTSGHLQVDILSMAGAEYAGIDGTNGPSKVASVGGTDSSGYVQEISVDSDGQLQIDVLTLPSIVMASSQFDVTKDSSATPTKLAAVAGFDGTNYRAMKTDTDGHFQVDILSGTIGSLSGIEFSVTKDSSAAPSKLAAIAGNDGTDYRALKTDTSGELQIDVLSLPSVTIGDSSFGVTEGSSTAPSEAVAIAGFDTTNFQYLITDTDGHLQIDVLSLPSVTIGATNFTTIAGSTTAPASIAIVGGKNNSTGLYAALNCDDNGVLYVNKSTNVTDGASTAPTYWDAPAAADYGGTYRKNIADTDGRLQTSNLTFAEALSVVSNITTTDETTLVAAPGDGSHVMPISVVLSGSGAGEFTLRNGLAGTIIFRGYIAAGGCIVLGPEQLSHCSNNAAFTVSSTAQPYSCSVKYQTLTP